MTEGIAQDLNTYSQPSQLKITDMRIAHLKGPLVGAAIIRIDTNQGISGYGEVHVGASKTYALMLKSRVLGENPCNVDKVFRKIKQFGYHGRQAAGVSAIEMALMDLAGKAYGTPAYQLAGGKFRDRILCYCDTPTVPDGSKMGERLKGRMEMGFKLLKMDVGIGLLRDTPGTVIALPGMLQNSVMHPFAGIQITEKGIEILCEYVAAVREGIGYEIPLATDHFGRIGLESCIRLCKALDRFSLAWYEDMIPWQFTDQLVRLSRSVDTPICTGEDIYLKEGFMELFRERAIAVAHPDLAVAGGILETKKIGDLAQDHGIAMALHTGGSPIATMAAVHCAAATENFLGVEIPAADDLERWSRLVEGLPVPLVQDGTIQVPETPGLGITGLNEELLREYLHPDDAAHASKPGFFGSTDEWDGERAHDFLWS